MDRYSMVRIERINTVKMSTLPRVIYRFNAIHIQIPVASVTDTGKVF